MTQTGTTLLHRWMEEVWNQGREATIDELMAEEAVIHGIVEGEMRGPDAFKGFVRMLRTAFPDLRVAVDDTVVTGAITAMRFTVTGTHTGPGLDADPPTQRPICFTGMCFVRAQDGKFVEGWNNVDFAAMHRQLGTV